LRRYRFHRDCFCEVSRRFNLEDSDVESESFQARSATLQNAAIAARVYAELGEKAFLDALAEPTMLACVERINMATQVVDEQRSKQCWT
jgi:hypothetical protein